jgi:hypothetical protein
LYLLLWHKCKILVLTIAGHGIHHAMQSVSDFLKLFTIPLVLFLSFLVRELVERGLHSFEAASMGNLMPTNADEAKRLIASLSRLSDDDVRECCSIVQRYREV